MTQMNIWGVKCAYCGGFNNKESHINLGVCKHCGGELPMPEYPCDDYSSTPSYREPVRRFPPTWSGSNFPSYSKVGSIYYDAQPVRPTTIVSNCPTEPTVFDNYDDSEDNEPIKPKDGMITTLLKKIIT